VYIVDSSPLFFPCLFVLYLLQLETVAKRQRRKYDSHFIQIMCPIAGQECEFAAHAIVAVNYAV
jgi:hypothetical protein